MVYIVHKIVIGQCHLNTGALSLSWHWWPRLFSITSFCGPCSFCRPPFKWIGLTIIFPNRTSSLYGPSCHPPPGLLRGNTHFSKVLIKPYIGSNFGDRLFRNNVPDIIKIKIWKRYYIDKYGYMYISIYVYICQFSTNFNKILFCVRDSAR